MKCWTWLDFGACIFPIFEPWLYHAQQEWGYRHDIADALPLWPLPLHIRWSPGGFHRFGGQKWSFPWRTPIAGWMVLFMENPIRWFRDTPWLRKPPFFCLHLWHRLVVFCTEPSNFGGRYSWTTRRLAAQQPTSMNHKPLCQTTTQWPNPLANTMDDIDIT